MRLLLAALFVTFAIAVTASVFAIWPAVADAPWEDEIPTPIVLKAPTPDRCSELIAALGNASGGGDFFDSNSVTLRRSYNNAGC